MHNLQMLEREIEKILALIAKLREEKQFLLNRINKLQLALKEVDKLKAENIAWQKNKDMVKLKIAKILSNLETLKQARGSSYNE